MAAATVVYGDAYSTLLQRYGVVFWRMLAREADRLPPWRDLLRVYRKLESRGEIRGGRFVAGFGGEQFAAADAVGRLRAVRKLEKGEELVALSGADPLNLVGTLLQEQRHVEPECLCGLQINA